MPLAALLCRLAQDAPEDPFRGLWTPIDLQLKDVPAREAFELFFDRAGSRLEIPDPGDEKLTLEIKDAPFWKAMDQLCRAHGGLRMPFRPFHARYPTLEAGAWVDYPVYYRGPLRFHVLDVGRIREVAYPRRLDRTDLTLMMSWKPDFTPVLEDRLSAGHVRLTRADDDRGTSLLPVLEGDVEYDYGAASHAGRNACGWLIRLGPAGAGAKAIRTLEGVWEGAFLREFDDLRFQNPAEEVGKTLKAGPVLVTLGRFSPRREGDDRWACDVQVKLDVDPSAPAEWREGLKKVPLERRIVGQVGTARPGRAPETRPILLTRRRGSDLAAPEMEGWHSGIPSSLTIRVAKTPRTAKVPFSFEGVRLP